MKKKLLTLLTLSTMLTATMPMSAMAEEGFTLVDTLGAEHVVALSDAGASMESDTYYVTVDEYDVVQLVTSSDVTSEMKVYELESYGDNKYGNTSLLRYTEVEKPTFSESDWARNTYEVTTDADYICYLVPTFEDAYANENRMIFCFNDAWAVDYCKGTDYDDFDDETEYPAINTRNFAVGEGIVPKVLYQNGTNAAAIEAKYNFNDEILTLIRKDDYKNLLASGLKGILFEVDSDSHAVCSKDITNFVRAYSLKPFVTKIVDGVFEKDMTPTYNVVVDKVVQDDKVLGGEGEAPDDITDEENTTEKPSTETPSTETPSTETKPVETPSTTTPVEESQTVETPTEVATFTLCGYIKDTNGNPIANATVELHSNPRTTTTDENGYWEFKNPEVGNHTLTAYVNGTKIYESKLAVSKTGYTKEVVMENENYVVETKNIAPTTGDIPLIGYFVMFIIGMSTICAGGYIYYNKKRKVNVK